MRIKTIFGLYLFLVFFVSCTASKKLTQRAGDSLINSDALKNAHVGISIFDPATEKFLFSYHADKYFVPASNTKLATCYAALKYLGDSLAGLRYVVNNNVIYIKPTGDPTFLHPDFAQQPVIDFLKNFEIIRMQWPLFNETFLGRGWSWDDYTESYLAQRSSFPVYGNVVSLKWIREDSVAVTPFYFKKHTHIMEPLNEGFEVEKPWEENRFWLHSGAAQELQVPFRPDIITIENLLSDTLKTWVQNSIADTPLNAIVLHSQPTDSVLKPMMHRSDNFFAEQLLLMAGNELYGEMNDAKTIDTILKTAFSHLPQTPRWVDGSGLSRYNLFSPNDFVAILQKMQMEFGMERLKTILPTGNEGTLKNYYQQQAGYIFGKTGTLSGVVAFSGYLYTQQERLLIFSTLVNNHHSSATEVRRAVEAFLQKVWQQY